MGVVFVDLLWRLTASFLSFKSPLRVPFSAVGLISATPSAVETRICLSLPVKRSRTYVKIRPTKSIG